MKKTTYISMEDILNLKKENDFETICERLEYDHIAYMYIKDEINSPMFKKGDIISLKRKDWYDEKDIVLYSLEGNYYLRRIIRKSDKSYFLCADNENEIRFIDESCILGKVISRERGNKRYSLVLNNKSFYVKTKMRKGKYLLTKDTISDDHIEIDNVYNQAESASYTSSIDRRTKLDLDNIIPLDEKLLRDIEQFKDPIEKVKEYEEIQERLGKKNISSAI